VRFVRIVEAARLPEGPDDPAPVTDAELAGLPAVVRRYLRFMGVIVLAEHGYGVLLFDARGHGLSEGTAMDFGWYGDRHRCGDGCADPRGGGRRGHRPRLRQ
jgi:pimeloyl-ACP methyl ester carboxylesterase